MRRARSPGQVVRARRLAGLRRATGVERGATARGALAAAARAVDATCTPVTAPRRRAVTARERELLRTANWETYSRHYNEQVPTIEEEFDIWGEYHQHRHEMRYDMLAAADRSRVSRRRPVLDVGCGSALVADRIAARDATYVGRRLRRPSHRLREGEVRAEPKALRTEFASLRRREACLSPTRPSTSSS